MRKAAIALFALALGLSIFAWWGLFTLEGKRRFDEMDGMYPVFAGFGALVCAVAAMILLAVMRWRP